MPRCKPDVVSVKFKNPDPGVQRIVEILKLGKRTVLYGLLIRHLPQRYKNERLAYKYVGSAMLCLAALFVTSIWWMKTPEWVRWLVVLLPMYRLWDIVRWWVNLLIDRRHFRVVSRERNVIFLAFNLVEIVFIGAILFRAAGNAGSLSGSWFDSFFLVTQLNLPAKDTAFWEQVAKAVIEGRRLAA